jgi:two-component system sensor histidine kinase/response regulator
MASSEDRGHILIVEDDQLMAQGLADILGIEGYQVETASNGRDALMKMQAHSPDLVLSDIMMPEMNGHEFCALVRANRKWRTLPFIFITALGQKIDHRRGYELGADDYLTKPFEPDDLLVAVRSRLKRAADHHAAAEAALADLRTSILITLNHEFRTPLTYITGYSRLLAEDGRGMDEESFQSCLHALLHGSERLKRLVENVLLVTQIESGELAAMIKMFPQETPNLNAITQVVIEDLRAEADTRRVVLNNHVPTDSPPLAISEEYVMYIIRHLLENAIKFCKEKGGQATVSAAEQEEEIELIVSDDGTGIRANALAWVFDSFRQVDRHKQEQQGAGLGLAIVRGLIQVHGGHVVIESELDIGTTVTVHLPIA